MPLVAGDDGLGARGQGALQDLLVTGIGSCSASPLVWEDQSRGFGQRFGPRHALKPRVFQSKPRQGFMVFRKQFRAGRSFAPSGCPCGETVKRCAAPEARASHDVSVEDYPQGLLALRTLSTVWKTAASSFGDCFGRSRPASSNDRTRAGVSARRFRSTINPFEQPTSSSSPYSSWACSRTASGITIWPLTDILAVMR